MTVKAFQKLPRMLPSEIIQILANIGSTELTNIWSAAQAATPLAKLCSLLANTLPPATETSFLAITSPIRLPIETTLALPSSLVTLPLMSL